MFFSVKATRRRSRTKSSDKPSPIRICVRPFTSADENVSGGKMIQSFSDEYHRYKLLAQKSLDQVSDEALNRVIAADGNSIAMLVRHISGNLISRFTDFLTTDGEKSWRDRDAEFRDQNYSREETERLWAAGWEVLESQLAQLSDADLEKTIYI